MVASPLPEAARGFFGMSAQASKPAERVAGAPPSTSGSILPEDRPSTHFSYASALAQRNPKQPSVVTKWQACDSCGHGCWEGGRACREGSGDLLVGQTTGGWFCRCCWEAWTKQTNCGWETWTKEVNSWEAWSTEANTHYMNMGVPPQQAQANHWAG